MNADKKYKLELNGEVIHWVKYAARISQASLSKQLENDRLTEEEKSNIVEVSGKMIELYQLFDSIKR